MAENNCKTMRSVTILGLTLALIFAQPPSQAMEPSQAMDKIELLNFGREIGWIQATCAYAEKRLLSFDDAESLLKGILKGIKKRYREDVPWGNEKISTYTIGFMREEAFRVTPSCRKYWPAVYF